MYPQVVYTYLIDLKFVDLSFLFSDIGNVDDFVGRYEGVLSILLRQTCLLNCRHI